MGPYAIGADANRLLGFEAFEPDQWLNADDSGSNLVFAYGTTIVGNVQLPGAGFRIDYGGRGEYYLHLNPADALFLVRQDVYGPILEGPLDRAG